MELRRASANALKTLVCTRIVMGTGALWIACLFLLLCPLPSHAQSSICAEVKIQIDQKVSLERQAFDAVLRIRNGLEGIQVEHIDVNVVFKDLSGADAHALFFSRLDAVSGITGSVVDGTGTVAPSSTGEAHWLIIPAPAAGPTPGAGGTEPTGRRYQIGATITYRMTGETVDRSVDVVPEIITVRPQPLLQLEYFLPSDVYGDDALTSNTGGPPPSEQPVPFTLGVRITNIGAGAAPHTTIESAQPKITKDGNPQGLLIDFHIDGSYVDDDPSQPSLLIDFGNIQPGASRMGRWVMTASLSGKFFDFSAEYTHADDLGGALTSLIQDPITYLLTHDVLVDLDGPPEHPHPRDNVSDFLAQAVGASEDGTYRVYESEGTVSEVVHQFDPTFAGSTLSFPSLSQGLLVYARTPISFDGQGRTVSAVRSDGRAVAPINVWFSKRRNASGDGWLYFLNLFEANPSTCGTTCSYSLTFDGAPSAASIAGVVYEDANANGVEDAGEQGLTGVTITASDGGSPRNVTTDVNGSYLIANLPAGTYALSVGSAPGHENGQHTIGNASGTASATGINGIVLGATTHATGYLFAKVPQTTQHVADLAITSLAASTTTPRAGQTFTLTLNAANAGPDTTAAYADLILPSALEVLSANPSAGTTFNLTTGHWTIGELPANGAASLTIQVRAASAGDIAMSASIASTDESVVDPSMSNNAASLAIQVGPAAAVHLQAELSRETRVLVLAHCVTDDADGAQCARSRASLFESYLGQRGVEHFATADAGVFLAELRSGRWNVYWIEGRYYEGSDFDDATTLDDTTIGELGAALFRGDSLVIDGTGSINLPAIEDWAGVTYVGQRSASSFEDIGFLPNSYLDYTGLAVSGGKPSFRKYASTTALATYSDDAVAITMAAHGSGRVLLFAFDLLDTLDSGSSLDALFAQINAAASPPLPSVYTADAYVPAVLKVENVGGAVSITESLDTPVGSHLVKTAPAPTTAGVYENVWATDLAAGGVYEPAIGIRTPSTDGTHAIAIHVTETGGSSLADQSLSLTVRGTNEQAAITAAAIASLNGGPLGAGLLQQAAAALQAALDARASGRANDAIAQLLVADAVLASDISFIGVDTTAVRTDLARLLQAFEREGYVAQSTCDPAGVSVVRDSGVSFVPLSDDLGMFERQERSTFQWELGTGDEFGSGNANLRAPIDPRITYQWTLSYDGIGNASLTVSNGAIVIGSIDYFFSSIVPGMPALNTGNAISLSAVADSAFSSVPPLPTATIEISTTSLNGTPLSDSIGNANGEHLDASLFYYSEGMTSGFVLSGTIKAGELPAPDDYTYFRIHAGNVSCKLAGR